ncbi:MULTISPECIES: hypothetical protein [unclassified Kitasatospora]|uniref:hypothetical protein n=1 Tax=unclassified Kitasatospora TaxID=2633591 RepID=UPI00070A63C7|nr:MULTISPECIES: hypothetical protein [unclassified Kitasatospora]KQV20544.1 hypothetical protein ASC99_21020 [Kitasatospora sp. Root107]KRB69125.1 hypothetical protein ASE03_28585 [Kitasatospora sp. Root187]
MTLSTDERRLLEKIVQAGKPVAPSDYFHVLYPPPAGMGEEGPVRDEWTEQQLGLYRVYIDLHDRGLIEVAVPADGANPDKVIPTDAGKAALA